MKLNHAFMAALTSVIWGLAFVATRFGLESFTAPQLTALRFLIAALPIIVIARPRISWTALILIGSTWFAGQFLLLFFAYEAGMPPGLASVTQQMQVFFTILFAALFLQEIPNLRQSVGLAVAVVGLLTIGITSRDEFRFLALGLAMAGAISWAVGNILIKRLPPDVPLFPLVVWASLVPPLPALVISAFYGNSASLLNALSNASWTSFGGVIYLGAVATLAYAVWGHLLQRYPATSVAPFALLSPCTGTIASALVFGEHHSPTRYGGMTLIVIGVAIAVTSPWRRCNARSVTE